MKKILLFLTLLSTIVFVSSCGDENEIKTSELEGHTYQWKCNLKPKEKDALTSIGCLFSNGIMGMIDMYVVLEKGGQAIFSIDANSLTLGSASGVIGTWKIVNKNELHIFNSEDNKNIIFKKDSPGIYISEEGDEQGVIVTKLIKIE